MSESSVDLEIEGDNDLLNVNNNRGNGCASSSLGRRLSGTNWKEFWFQVFRWFRILALPVVGIIYWVGLWNLLNLYVLPEYGVPAGFIRRDGLYILVGTIGNLAIKLYWPPRVFSREGELFQWRHQLIRFLRLLCVVSLGVVFWTGAWNFIDTAWYESTRNRELVYIVIAIPILFFLDVVFSSPALRHMLALQMDRSIYDDDNIFSVWN